MVFHSFQVNAAFAFFLIFVPWIGMLGALRGKKNWTYTYLIILSITLLVYLITSSVILSNSYVRDLWKTTRSIDSTEISAVEEAFLASYNMIIAQIILIWFFLVGTGVATYSATQKMNAEQFDNMRPLRD
eukprot:TRINITY_DN7388_c0_g1_i1.p3 TRINITY_DN7388_c0_g1~~TRINITY_DN7388_c0_g1_i1.p3  ORF type:complete len:130 (+),score=3.92 TRINITY_DN7388_c0_g1_i1:202-591(+)